MISSVRDQLQPTVYNKMMVRTLSNLGKDATLVEIESNKGHMAGVLDNHLFAEDVRDFLK